MSTPAYCTYVQFKQDYKNIKKGEIRCATRFTDNPGNYMGMVGEPNPYKIWYSIYDNDIEDAYYAPRETERLFWNVPEQYVEEIFSKEDDRIKKYKLKVQRKNKLKKIKNKK